MVKRTQAQKDAEKRWQSQNPTSTVRLPQHSYDALKQAAKDSDMTYHGLLKQILTEWLETK